MDCVLDHAFAVEVEVELHGPELRVDVLLDVRVPRVFLEFVFPSVELLLVLVVEVLFLLLVGHDGVAADVFVEVVPVLRDASRCESDLRCLVLSCHDAFSHHVIHHH